MLLPAIIAFAVGTLVFYTLAALPSGDERSRSIILNVVSTLVLLHIGVRAAKAALAGLAAHTCHSQVLQRLVNVGDKTMLHDLAVCYELQRVRDPLIPTRLYRRHRQRLAKDWKLQQKAFPGKLRPKTI